MALIFEAYMDEIAKEAAKIGASADEVLHAWIGFIPDFLSPDCEDSAAKQIGRNYKHGGGWRPLEGYSLDLEPGIVTHSSGLQMRPIAAAVMRAEVIAIYPRGYVAIIQPNGVFEIAKVD